MVPYSGDNLEEYLQKRLATLEIKMVVSRIQQRHHLWNF